jgi:hypothetical protein
VRVTDSIVLVCAVLGSLACGVLLAYGVCLAMFRIFQMRAEQAAIEAQPAVVRAAQIVEG